MCEIKSRAMPVSVPIIFISYKTIYSRLDKNITPEWTTMEKYRECFNCMIFIEN